MAQIHVIHSTDLSYGPGEMSLSYQFVAYPLDRETVHTASDIAYGYRFINKDPGGGMKPQMGQARIPNTAIIQTLIAEAVKQGWGSFNGQVERGRIPGSPLAY
jgi:hypothetical protein